MSDASTPPTQGANNQPGTQGKFPFYPGIAANRLYFHKTPREKFDAILRDGLPQSTGGGNPLARRISYASDKRYSGGSGYILGFKPEPGEIPEISPQFAREVAIAASLSVLPPERNVFNIPGVSQLPWKLFESVRQIIDDYYAAGRNNAMLQNALSDLFVAAEELMRSDAQLKNPDEFHLLTQEVLWNEFCAATTRIFDNVSFHVGQIADIRAKQQQLTYEDLLQHLRSETVLDDFDRAGFENDVNFLSTIHTIEGLGFEGHPYPIDDRMKESVAWVKSLPDELPLQQSSHEKKGGIAGFLKKLGLG